MDKSQMCMDTGGNMNKGGLISPPFSYYYWHQTLPTTVQFVPP